MKSSAQPRKGFTLIELLVVVTIITILSGFAIPGFTRYSDNQSIRQGREQIKSDLRLIQNRTLAGVGAVGTDNFWVIEFADDAESYSYYLSEGTTWNTDCPANPTEEITSEKLPGDTIIRNGPICVFMDFDDGNVVFKQNGDTAINCSSAGNCVITIGFSTTANPNCEGIEINTFGGMQGVDGVDCE